MIVLDASAALVALLRTGPARGLVASEQVHAPHLVDLEVASALRRLVSGTHLSTDAATTALTAFSRLGISRYAATGLLPRIWELRDTVTAYDAAYVALAEELGCPLVTADARLGRAPGARCVVTVVPS